jgi:hypothetical protein
MKKNSKQNTKFNKICALSKIHISPNLIIKKHITYWGNYKYNIKSFKTFHLQILLEESIFFGKKDPKKDNSPKYKINTLAHYMSFGPKYAISFFFFSRVSQKNHLCGSEVSYIYIYIYIYI